MKKEKLFIKLQDDKKYRARLETNTSGDALRVYLLERKKIFGIPLWITPPFMRESGFLFGWDADYIYIHLLSADAEEKTKTEEIVAEITQDANEKYAKWKKRHDRKQKEKQAIKSVFSQYK